MAPDQSSTTAFDQVHFNNSELVRRWLVLRAVVDCASKHRAQLESQTAEALHRAREAVRRGEVAFDYVPPLEDAFDLPRPENTLYSQALLYWCTRFDCSAEHLVEAHSLLGARPRQERMTVLIAQIECSAEDDHKYKPKENMYAATVPEFQGDTVPLVADQKPKRAVASRWANLMSFGQRATS